MRGLPRPSGYPKSQVLRGYDTSTGRAGYCVSCKTDVPRGPDACLGYLDGVAYACCGHGDLRHAYVVVVPDGVSFEFASDGLVAADIAGAETLREWDALDYFAAQGKQVLGYE